MKRFITTAILIIMMSIPIGVHASAEPVKISEEQDKEKVIEEAIEEVLQHGIPSTWAKDKIEKNIKRNYVPTNIQSEYQNFITRKEFAQLLVTAVFEDFNNKLSEKESIIEEWDFKKLDLDNFLSKVSTTERFIDTESKYVKIANMLGMINGVGFNRFEPDEYITREQVAVMLINYFQTAIRGIDPNVDCKNSSRSYKPESEKVFADYSSLSFSGKEAVNRLLVMKILGGEKAAKYDKDGKVVEKGVFGAKNNLTREQAIVLVGNVMDEFRKNYSGNTLFLRGYIAVNMDQLMSGFDIQKDTVKMKKSGYNNLYSVCSRYLSDYYYKTRTGALLKYNSEKIDALYLMPARLKNSYRQHSMYKTDNIDRILNGDYARFDYGALTIEHNKDGYLAVATKNEFKGFFYGSTWINDSCLYSGGAWSNYGIIRPIIVTNDEIYDDYDGYYKKEYRKLAMRNEFFEEAIENPHNAINMFTPKGYEAWRVANKLINSVIRPGMSDKQKVNAVVKVLNKHASGWYNCDLYLLATKDNYNTPYNVFVEKFSDLRGWYEAYKMAFSIAGLDTFKRFDKDGTLIEGKEIDKIETALNIVAVKIDGKWTGIDISPSLPKKYKESVK